MNKIKMTKRVVVGALSSGAIAAAGMGLGAGSAAAQSPAGTWCPGQPPPIAGMEFDWDMNVCHDYWFVSPGRGNVGIKMEGKPMDSWMWIDSVPAEVIPQGPPPPPPPPPAPGSYCATNPIGCHFFGPYGLGRFG